MANSSRFRADQVGSLLRPQALLEARRRFDGGMIEAEELRAVEDEAIAEAVKLQKAAGIDIVTDGEFRRQDFRSSLLGAFDGLEMKTSERAWHGSDGDVMLLTRQYVATGRLNQVRRLAEGEVPYLKSLTTAPVKVTLLAPGFAVDRLWEDGVTSEFYDSRDELAAVLAKAVHDEIEMLIAEGAAYVQIDNPGYGALVDEEQRESMVAAGRDPEEALSRMLATDAAAVAGIDRPHGVSLGLHVCHGNQSSLWLSQGGYDEIAERLFNEVGVDRFLLEYDDERAGDFEPLRLVPEGRTVVLGLVSSKSADLESIDELQARIDQAAEVIDTDYLALSPQCGFASVSDGGNRLTQQDEYDKLQLVADTALATWGIEL